MFVGKVVKGEVVPMSGRPIPGVGLIVAISNPESSFYGRLARVDSVADRTVFLVFVGDPEGSIAFPFGASEVVALAPGEVTEVFGR